MTSETQETGTLDRLGAINAELVRAAAEYTEAKTRYHVAQMRYEGAREQLAAIKRRARAVVSTVEWFRMQNEISEAKYAAMNVGEAIDDVLWDKSWAAAAVHVEDGRPYVPGMTLVDITEALLHGGFDFRSQSAPREVNAAIQGMLKSGALARDEKRGTYALADANERIREFKEALGQEEE